MPLDPDTATLVQAYQTGDRATFNKAIAYIAVKHFSSAYRAEITKATRGSTVADLIKVIETTKALTAATTKLADLNHQLQETQLATTEDRIKPADQRHATIIKVALTAAEQGKPVHNGLYRQSEILAAQRFHAGQIRLDGETDRQVNARAWSTPEGQALRKALATAVADAPIEVMKSTVGEATAEVQRRAEAIRKAAGHTIEKARTIVRSQDPDLARREAAESRGA